MTVVPTRLMEEMAGFHDDDLDLDAFGVSLLFSRQSHDRGLRTVNEPEWLEVVGHPTIPHVQSLRAPPAQVALHTSKENLIGLTNRTMSKRYLEKLQREREKNQEVLAECVDNLPIVIRQMVYPEKPSPKTPWRNSATERKFRVGKHTNDNFWQENIDHWVESEHLGKVDSPRQYQQRQRNGNPRVTSNTQDRKHSMLSSSLNSEKAETVLSQEFIHHQGFQGSPESQSTNLKYKFGKKKTNVIKDPQNQHTTFRPKGFGALYDELEFERRYKKVFDLNKHIHFVHSNFLSGQRLYKRHKLPPIGHIPSVQSDPTDNRDIFAIMSVQRFNYPEGSEIPRAPVTSPGQGHRSSDGFPARLHPHHKRNIEITQDLDVPLGFVPGTVKPTGNSPFDGVKGSVMQKEGGYRLSMASTEGDSALGTLTEESSPPGHADDLTCSQSEMSAKTMTSKKTKHTDDNKSKASHKKKHSGKKREKKQELNEEHDINKENTVDDNEPFNISVHVAIKPKDPQTTGGDDVENERARELQMPIIEQPETPSPSDTEADESTARTADEDTSKSEERVLFPTEYTPRSASESEDGEKIIRPKNIAMTTNQFGFVTQKVQYPDRFVLNDSLVEEDEKDIEKDEAVSNNNRTDITEVKPNKDSDFKS